MLFGFIGRVSSADSLKTSLDDSTLRARAIAGRVASATVGAQNGFALPTAGGANAQNKVDLEQEMVSLADEQLRFDATAKLLEKTYAQVRASLQSK
jgi:flagellar basal body rod protein FlgB